MIVIYTDGSRAEGKLLITSPSTLFKISAKVDRILFTPMEIYRLWMGLTARGALPAAQWKNWLDGMLHLYGERPLNLAEFCRVRLKEHK